MRLGLHFTPLVDRRYSEFAALEIVLEDEPPMCADFCTHIANGRCPKMSSLNLLSSVLSLVGFSCQRPMHLPVLVVRANLMLVNESVVRSCSTRAIHA